MISRPKSEWQDASDSSTPNVTGAAIVANRLRLGLALCVVMPLLWQPARAQGTCALDLWADELIAVWSGRGVLANAACYANLITSMDTGRAMRDQVISRFDRMFPRAGYKVVGLDPINARLPGLDRPMVGVMYVSMFLPDGATIPLSSAASLMTEPDLLFSVKDEGINAATTLDAVLRHVDRVYGFIEVVAPTFENKPPNSFMMQASNLLPRWGVIGESIEARADQAFLRSLETMRVTFRDGRGRLLADQRGAYLGGNPLHSVLVVISELRRRSERLHAGDLISAGSFMPPMSVESGMFTEAVYEGLTESSLRVSARYQ